MIAAVGIASALALLWIAYRAPATFLLLALASFALGLRWLLAGHVPSSVAGLSSSAHKVLLVIALTAHALRYGVRTEPPNWPLLAVVALLLQTFLLAELAPDLGRRDVALAAFGLAVPWMLVHAVLAPRTRHVYALVIMLLAPLCVAAGLLTDALGIYRFHVDGVRLQGATNAGWLAFLAFLGFAVAVHEALRTARPRLAYLAALNLSLVILSGGRMGMIACLTFAAAYALAWRGPRPRLGRFAPALAVGGAVAALVFVLYLPHLADRMLRGGGMSLSGRGGIWLDYLQMFQAAPLFGHGLGATATGSYFDLPHNEYLRLLVEGGVVGFAMFAAAVILWGRALLRHAHPIERPFIIALFLALAVYALTDNVLVMPPAMVAFAYLGVVLSEPGPAPAARDQAAGPWLRRRDFARRL